MSNNRVSGGGYTTVDNATGGINVLFLGGGGAWYTTLYKPNIPENVVLTSF